jgi:hypothetical protein
VFKRPLVQALVVSVLTLSDALLRARVLEHLLLEAQLDILVGTGDWLLVGFVLWAIWGGCFVGL